MAMCKNMAAKSTDLIQEEARYVVPFPTLKVRMGVLVKKRKELRQEI